MDNKIDAFSMETLPTEAIVLPLYERPLFPGTFTTLSRHSWSAGLRMFP